MENGDEFNFVDYVERDGMLYCRILSFQTDEMDLQYRYFCRVIPRVRLGGGDLPFNGQFKLHQQSRQYDYKHFSFRRLFLLYVRLYEIAFVGIRGSGVYRRRGTF